jgi:hypothetical protein
LGFIAGRIEHGIIAQVMKPPLGPIGLGPAVAVALVAPAALLAQSASSGGGLEATLARVSRRVEAYYATARTVLCTDRVLLLSLRSDLTPRDRGRELVYELRVQWEPPAAGEAAGDAQIVRRLLSVDGRPARPGDEPGCTDPKPVSLEPLAMFLGGQRDRYVFSWAGAGREDDRDAVLLDYRSARPTPPAIKWQGDCVTVDVPAKTRGRAWIDAETGDVLRLDEHLVGLFDIPVPRAHQERGSPAVMTIERSDTSIRYQPVTFSNPDETLLLPSSVDTLSIVRNAGTPRLRMIETFSDYERFVTGGRIIR